MVSPHPIGAVLPLLVQVPMAGCGAAKAVTFYVARDGNDKWSGALAAPNRTGTDGPFATLTRARDAVRKLAKVGLKQPVRVLIRGGTHFLQEPLVLGPQDSGTKECPITYAAYRGEEPILSGGVAIGGWKEVTIRGMRVWAAELPEVRAGEWYFRELYVNGQRRFRPKLPKEGFAFFAGFLADGQGVPWNAGQTQMTFKPGDIRAWKNLQDIEVVAFTRWVDNRQPVASVDMGKRIVTFTKKSVQRLEDCRNGQPGPYWVENVFEALDTPGQWYLDRPTGTLYYYPMSGEKMSEVEVIAPRLEQVVRVEGTASKPVTNLRFDGLTFSHTQWELPPDASGAAQAAVNVPGAVLLTHAQDCRFRKCAITHVGTYAIEFGAGCKGNRVERTAMLDLGGGGVKIGHDSSGTTVSDCDIGDGGHIFHPAVGVWIGHSPDNRVVHNDIHDLYYSGVSVGWVWGYAESKAVRNIVEWNHIHDIGKGLLSDMGGIYTLGVSPGTRLRYNLIHDVESFGYGGWGLYTDEGSTNILLENNIVYNTKTGGFHQHYGKENIVRNNVFAFSREGQIIRSREEEHSSFTFERNIVLWKESPLLGGNWGNGNYAIDRNLYWRVGGGQFDFAGMTFDEWKAKGRDVHSIIADPLFVAPEKGDFTLKPNSPALGIGFKPIDLSKVGRRP
jgi:parallel beta-helix repeat protein